MADIEKPEKTAKPKFGHLSVRIRRDVLKQARATAIMTDQKFHRFVERALLAAMSTKPETTP